MTGVINTRKIILILGDIFLLYGSLCLALSFNFGRERALPEAFWNHVLPFSILYFFWLVSFFILGLYDLNLIRPKINLYRRLSGGLIVGVVLGMLFFYLVPIFGIAPKTNLVLNLLIFGVLFLLWHNFFYSLFSAYLINKVVILGQGSEAKQLSEEIEKRPYLGYRTVTEINTSDEDFVAQILKVQANTIVITQEIKNDPEILQKLYQSAGTKVDFFDFPKAYEIICQKVPLSAININWFLENSRAIRFYDRIKRALDIILAGVLLTITAPLLPGIALAIKLEDKGPVFYKQKRVGEDKKVFDLVKFRSMVVDAEKNQAVWAEQQDPRTTKTGRFIRKTHLDELPQLVNIIRGDISLVGPRPERPEFVEDLEEKIPYYHLRHMIKPGLTGWAQIKFRYGRSVQDSLEKFQYDLYYLKNRSFFLDLGILLKTFLSFFK